MSRLAVLVALACAVPPATARAAPLPDERAAPDPRNGERLDGRSAPRDGRETLAFVPRALLWLPRMAALVVLTPVEYGVRAVEEERIIDHARRLTTSRDGLIKLRPIVWYQSGWIPLVGLRYTDQRTLGPGTRFSLAFRTGGVDRFDAEADVRPFAAVPATLGAEIERDPDELFAGIDGVTRDELDEQGRGFASYHADRRMVWLSLGERRGRWTWDLGLDLVSADYDDGDPRGEADPIEEVYCDVEPCRIDDDLVPGFTRGLLVTGLSGGLSWSTRPLEDRFGTGVGLGVRGRVAEGLGDDPSRHASIESDVLVSFAWGERELSLRALAGVVDELDDAPVPFEELLSPSGDDAHRALSNGRLRGHTELLYSLEYRWFVVPAFDAIVFVDWGGAFEREFANLSGDTMIPGIGFGIRTYALRDGRYWHIRSRSNLQVAWAPDEGYRLVISINE
jgi:hypothetical protein